MCARTYDASVFTNLPGSELTARRTEGGKVFSLGIGRYQAIAYGEPVHYLSGGE